LSNGIFRATVIPEADGRSAGVKEKAAVDAAVVAEMTDWVIARLRSAEAAKPIDPLAVR